MTSFKEQLDIQHLPQHIAIIMDGNGRWARSQGKPRVYGHQHGVDSVYSVMEGAAQIGLKYLTLYAFSTENWNRPSDEVNALMDLFVEAIHSYLQTMLDNNIRLQVIGDLERLPLRTRTNMQSAIDQTAHCTGLTLVLAISYSSRWEILRAARLLAADAAAGRVDPQHISEEKFSSYLCTASMPDPDLLIRTSGELRLSNFLMWQLSYAELYFTQVPWPEFKKENLYQAIVDFQGRERRFGKTSEQFVK